MGKAKMEDVLFIRKLASDGTSTGYTQVTVVGISENKKTKFDKEIVVEQALPNNRKTTKC